jgi:AcrR family transcriptional regulator
MIERRASRSGRPRVSSRETIAEAACELFLERRYDATSISDITRRAGVSRSSFFNYFASKADILWGGLDDRVARAEGLLAHGESPRMALRTMVADFAPDSLALAYVNADAMGLADELHREAALRRARIAAAVAARLRAAGVETLPAEVAGAAFGGAVLAAIQEWVRQGAGTSSLPELVRRALDLVAPLDPLPQNVRPPA